MLLNESAFAIPSAVRSRSKARCYPVFPVVFIGCSAYAGIAVQAEEPMAAKGDRKLSSKGLAF